MPTAEQKIAILEGSQRCLRHGAASLIPWFGLPYAISAIVRRFQMRAADPEGWNPGRRCLAWGCALAGLGLIVNLAAYGLLLAWIQAAFG
ncbi:MAG TPA: hypothetical protein PKM73_01675 [Verrucomicrobiota bacterium]|nr:hypothetical protein [Verrucomicrobiota bacterium]HNU49378.1 hypothetical protein [Verrucomicrobiota bacterium]